MPKKNKKTGSHSLRVGRRSLRLTALGRTLYPKSGYTKYNVVDYYRRIARHMLPYTKGRPLVLHRFAHGIADKSFYQKDASAYFPSWIPRVRVLKKGGGSTNYLICNEAATLVYLANQLTLTFHTWQSQATKLNYPDKLIFDFDPPPRARFELVRWAALECKKLLDELGLPSFVMTTGSRGLHVVVPLQPKHSFTVVRTFAKQCAELLIARHPKKLTLEMRKADRGRRLFVDILRNTYAQISVAPYSLRAKPGAPIATPISWQELSRSDMNSQRYTIANIFQRLARGKNPWHNFKRKATTLTAARKQLKKIIRKNGSP